MQEDTEPQTGPLVHLPQAGVPFERNQRLGMGPSTDLWDERDEFTYMIFVDF